MENTKKKLPFGFYVCCLTSLLKDLHTMQLNGAFDFHRSHCSTRWSWT